jgi:hypothetical protein
LTGAGSNEGSVASAQPGDAGAEKIAARFALAGFAWVEIWPALERELISSSKANAKGVNLSFMRVSFEGRFTDELPLAAALQRSKVPDLPFEEPDASSPSHRRIVRAAALGRFVRADGADDALPRVIAACTEVGAGRVDGRSHTGRVAAGAAGKCLEQGAQSEVEA